MADMTPPSIKVQTTSLNASIGFGIACLGAIPIRYNQPRFPSLRRRWQDDTREKQLIQLGGGQLPDMFALSSFTSLGKASTKQAGNPAVMRAGVNFKGNNGQRFRLSGTYVEVQCTGTVYSASLDDLIFWMTSVIETPGFIGQCVFDEGMGFDVGVNIEPRLDWTDPVEASEGGRILDRFYSSNVTFVISTLAARVSSMPLFRSIIKQTQVEGEATIADVEISLAAEDDWP